MFTEEYYIDKQRKIIQNTSAKKQMSDCLGMEGGEIELIKGDIEKLFVVVMISNSYIL